MTDIAPQHVHFQTSELCHKDVYNRLAVLRKGLTDLRNKSKRNYLEDSSVLQEEIKKVKEETEEEWKQRLDRMEEKLRLQEDRLSAVQEENRILRHQLETGQLDTSACSDKLKGVPNGYVHMNGHGEDDPVDHESSNPTKSIRQDCDRLQDQLVKAEQRADELNLLLNQKLIELNKLQLTLSKQTKEMIELEKSYIQLQCRLRRGATKPSAPRICSISPPFSTRNSYPKILSPPESPRPGI